MKKKSIKTKPKKMTWVNCQNRNSDHESDVTLWKTNQNKLWISIHNKFIVEGCY
jgi:hypothetical protein